MNIGCRCSRGNIPKCHAPFRVRVVPFCSTQWLKFTVKRIHPHDRPLKNCDHPCKCEMQISRVWVRSVFHSDAVGRDFSEFLAWVRPQKPARCVLLWNTFILSFHLNAVNYCLSNEERQRMIYLGPSSIDANKSASSIGTSANGGWYWSSLQRPSNAFVLYLLFLGIWFVILSSDGELSMSVINWFEQSR
jgi:hypothetical protein